MILYSNLGFPGDPVVKNPTANAGDTGDAGLIPGSGRSPGGGNGNPLYSCLGTPTDRGAWQAIVHGVTKSWTWLSNWTELNTKINSKWNKYLLVRPETIKLLEENISKTLSNINHSRILYDPPPRIMEIKAKINKWDLIKLKSFCTKRKLWARQKDSLQNGRK